MKENLKKYFEKQIEGNKVITKELLEKLDNKEYTSGKLKKIGDKPLYCFIVEVVDGNDVEMSLAQLSEEELPEYEKKFKISEQHTNTKHLPTLISKNLLD